MGLAKSVASVIESYGVKCIGILNLSDVKYRNINDDDY